MKLIDARGRPPGIDPYFDPRRGTDQAAMIRMVNERVASRSPEHFLHYGESPSGYFEMLDHLGIQTVVVFGKQHKRVHVTNDAIAEYAAQDPRFVGLGAIDPLCFPGRRATEEVRRVAKLGLRAVNVDPGLLAKPMLPHDRRLYPIYSECEKLGLPVWIMSGPFSGPSLEYTEPKHYGCIAQDFPALRLVIGHGCYPFVEEAIGLVVKHPNLYLSPDIYTFMPGAQGYREAMRSHLAGQFLFGTGYPFRDMAQTVEDFLALGLDDEKLAMCGWKAVSRLLAISDG